MMRNKIIKIVSVMLFVFFTGVICVNADFSVEKDEVNCGITISGLPSSSQVVVVDFLLDDIIKDGKKFSELSNSDKVSELNEHLVYLRQTTDTEHKPGLSAYGAYTVFVNDGDSVKNKEVVLFDPEFVSNYQGASDKTVFVELLENSKSFMRVEAPLFYELSEIDRKSAANKLFTERAEQADRPAIKERMEFYAKLQKLVSEQSIAVVISEFEGLSDEIGFEDFSKKEVYEKSSDEFKAAVIKRFIIGNIGETSRFDDDFTKAVLLEQVKTALSTSIIKGIAKEIEDTFGISSAKYKALGSDTITADQAVKGKNYDTIEAFIAALETNSEKPNNGGGGGSSSSSRKDTYIIKDTPSTPEPDKAVSDGFYDVPSNRWSYESINSMKKMNILAGDGNKYFRPEDRVTRAEFVKIAVSAFDLLYENADSNFSDVVASDWSYPYISSATHFGVIKGRNGSEFAPSDNITREEASVIIYNIMSVKQMIGNVSRDSIEFTDKDVISSWAFESVEYLYRSNILDGMGDNTFKPKDNMTREQAAHLIFKVIKTLS